MRESAGQGTGGGTEEQGQGRSTVGKVTAAILAGGPSLTPAQVAAVRGLFVIAVNDAHRLAPWASILFSADPAWWEYHRGVHEFAGRRVCTDSNVAYRFGLEYVRGRKAAGLAVSSAADPVVHWGQNSGHAAINLAVNEGATRVLLLGFDLKLDARGRRHWFGDHPPELVRSSCYASWALAFERIAEQAPARGVEIVNCSPDTALRCFPRVPLANAIGRAKNVAAG